MQQSWNCVTQLLHLPGPRLLHLSMGARELWRATWEVKISEGSHWPWMGDFQGHWHQLMLETVSPDVFLAQITNNILLVSCVSMPFGSQNLQMHGSKCYWVSREKEFFPSLQNGLFYLKIFNQTIKACMSLQSCLSLCNTMDCSWPGSSVHGILQERILEWVAMPSSRGSSRTRNRTPVPVSCIGTWVLYH